MAATSPPRVRWSERERQVLHLISRGKTNGEIATDLQISFATAKWHVSQLISKLGVSSREELAEYWRAETRPVARLRRAFTWEPLLPAALAAAGVAALAVALVSVLAIIPGGSDEPPPAAPGPATTPSPAMPSPLPTRTTPRTPPGVPPTVSGTVGPPQPAVVDETYELNGTSVFAPWDGASTVLYDMFTGEETNLGPGSLGAFSPNGRWFAWVAGTAVDFQLFGTAFALELASGRRIELGEAMLVQFVDHDTVALIQPPPPTDSNPKTPAVNLGTGEHLELDPDAARNAAYRVITGRRATTPDGLTVSISDPAAIVAQLYDRLQQYEVRDATGNLYLAFEANYASASDADGEVIAGYIADDGWLIDYFAIDVATGDATVLVTGTRPGIAANEDWAAVSEGICYDHRSLLLLERATGRLTRITLSGEQTSSLDFDRRGRLVIGNLVAPSAVIDLDALRYVARLPEQEPGGVSGGGHIAWSPDLRYANRGWALGPTDSC